MRLHLLRVRIGKAALAVEHVVLVAAVAVFDRVLLDAEQSGYRRSQEDTKKILLEYGSNRADTTGHGEDTALRRFGTVRPRVQSRAPDQSSLI
jgi:hypothetical protein